MILILFSIILLSYNLFMPITHASQFFSNHDKIIEQRNFLKEKLKEKDWGEINPEAYQNELHNYPLYADLEYYYLLNHIKKSNRERFSNFFITYPKFQHARYLRKQLLLHLGKKKQWQDFNKFYKSPEYYSNKSSVNIIECYKITSDLLNTRDNKIQKIYQNTQQQFEKVFLQGKELPDNCQSALKIFNNANIFDEATYIKRAVAAIKNNNIALANTTIESIDNQSSDTIYLWKALIENPYRLESALHENNSVPTKTTKQVTQKAIHKTINNTPLNRIAIIHALKKILLEDTELTKKLWLHYSNKIEFPEKEKEKFLYDSAITLYINNSLYFNSWLDIANSQHQHETLNKKLLILAIKSNAWADIISLYKKIDKDEQNTGIWKYWLAKSYMAYDESNNIHPNALNILKELSTERHYYGFLASLVLNTPPSLNNTASFTRDADLRAVAQNHNIIRAHEFFMLKEPVKASRAWYLGTVGLNKAQRGHAAMLAYQWGWLRQAIASASGSSEFNNITMRFPQGFAEHVNFYSTLRSIPNEWVYSVIRQESAYAPQAKSRAGAFGLMQIMPATGDELAEKNNLSDFKFEQLKEPELNINLASYYLAELKNQYQQNMLLASAAYNAGPSNVNRWLNEARAEYSKKNLYNEGNLPMEIWIETIPFKETRNYVKNIATYQIIYQLQLGRQPNFEHILKPIQLKPTN